MDALAFIEKDGTSKRQPYYVVSGDEDFMRRRVLSLLPAVVLGDADPAYAVTTFPGDKTDFSAVRNELDSVSFFSERRLVIVEQADAFVSKFRPQLEEYITKPAEKGVLVLDVKSFPANTKLAKAVPEACHIICVSPKEYRLPHWCVEWCQSQYGKKLAASASQMLVQFVGATMGVLDQELQKLKDFVGDRATIEPKDVDELTGRSRGANVFKIMEAVGDGQPKTALKILTDLFEEGEEPLKLLGALGYQLRQLARAARMNKLGMALDEALVASKVPPFAREGAKKQLRHLGWNRLDRIYDWLLETDSGLKGGSPLPERLQMERLVVRLARPRPN